MTLFFVTFLQALLHNEINQEPTAQKTLQPSIFVRLNFFLFEGIKYTRAVSELIFKFFFFFVCIYLT